MTTCITERKDGRFMGRIVIGQDEKGKTVYQYVYGNSYDEAYKKVQIGIEVESRYKNASFLNHAVSAFTALSASS